MIISKVERRSDVYRNNDGEKFNAAVVREGVVLQLKVNTVSAIEYMKNRGIAGATIQRVLSGHQLRSDDKQAISSLTSGN